MAVPTPGVNRRDFLRTSAAGGFSLGGLLGLGAAEIEALRQEGVV